MTLLLSGVLLASSCNMSITPTDAPAETIGAVTITAPQDTDAPTEAPTDAPTEPAGVVTSPADDSIPEPETPDEPDPDAPVPAPELTFADQFGVTHSLSDYKGKVVFLNFWATWCGPCKIEMPDIQKAYDKYGKNEEDVIILGVASPRSETNTLTYEGTKDEVIQFLTDGDFTYPSLLDESGESFAAYGIHSIPMTYMIDRDGNIFGLMRGMVDAAQIDMMIQMTLDGEKP